MNYWKSYLEDNPLGIEPLLKLADRAYRIGCPIMDDADYDEIIGDIEPDIDDNPENDGVAIDLNPPMLSQQKTYNASDLGAIVKQQYTASLKLDGFAVSLVYENGVFSYATTRGKGTAGLTVTNHILAGCMNIPWIIRSEVLCGLMKLEIRGEMIIPKKFGDEKHNPRSICVGLFGRDDWTELEEYEPQFFAYDMIDGTRTHANKLTLLEQIGFNVVPWCLGEKDEVEKIIKGMEEWRANLPVEADGIVFRINDPVIFHSKGATKHHPKGSIALKFNTDAVITTVVGIEWSEGEKTGKMTPIVSVEPVTLGGCEIRKLNGGLIANSLSVGDKIQITRKGGVIPVILAKL